VQQNKKNNYSWTIMFWTKIYPSKKEERTLIASVKNAVYFQISKAGDKIIVKDEEGK